MLAADWIALVPGPLDQDAVTRHLDVAEAGGRVTFAGHVRPREDGVKIAGLHYEHYPAMALRQMEHLAAELHAKWPIVRLAMVHRTGPVPVGEAAVLIGVACPHRREAFAACETAIERLKQIVPIWKGPAS